MKHNQAWGWLMAAVMAAGLNASYHNGDMQWLHRVAEDVGHSTGAVLALASGRADRFLADARFLTAGQHSTPCPLSLQLAEVREEIPAYLAKAQSTIDAISVQRDVTSARAEVRNVIRNDESLAKLEAQRDRMQAQRDRMQAEIEVRAARLEVAANFDRAAFRDISENFSPVPAVMLKRLACPRERNRMRINLQIPKVGVPEIRFDAAGAEPF